METTIQFDLYEKEERYRYPLIQLTQKNVAIAEFCISNDAAYLKSGDPSIKPNKYNQDYYEGGSTAYWVKCLADMLTKNKCEDLENFSLEVIVKSLVVAIDRENSTHLNADGCGRNEISERILEFINSHNNFYEQMKDRKIGFELYNTIIAGTHPNDSTKKARKNKSFASKFCHYICFFMYKDKETEVHHDNFSIMDSIVKTVLPIYMEKFGIAKTDLENYEKYSRVIDEIRNKLPHPISRNGFDHLLWYYYKGRLPLEEKSKGKTE